MFGVQRKDTARSTNDFPNIRSIYFRSVSSWFDEDGVLLFEVFSSDVEEMHHSLKKEKAQ